MKHNLMALQADLHKTTHLDADKSNLFLSHCCSQTSEGLTLPELSHAWELHSRCLYSNNQGWHLQPWPEARL